MAKLGQAQEPSMEEILASIRRIISDDDQKTTAVPPVPKLAVVETARIDAPPRTQSPEKMPDPRPPATPQPAHGRIGEPEMSAADHILELSEADAAPADDELDAADVAFAELAVEEATSRQAVPPPSAPPPGETPGDRRLLSHRTDEAVNSAFNHLAATFLTNQARSLEDIVKEMMRPMLKSWLDDNLPPLVERLVREEIERVSRGRR